MKLEALHPLLFIFGCLTCLSSQTSLAESFANIEYPETIVKDDNGDELIHIQAVAQLSNFTINGLKVSELSDLAWDADEELLYALSDNGYLCDYWPSMEGTAGGHDGLCACADGGYVYLSGTVDRGILG